MSIFDSVMNDESIVWSSDWKIDSKPWDYDRPLHRINSPSFNKQSQRVTGEGYKCGCRSPNDYHFTLDQLKSIAGALGIPFPLSLPLDIILLPILLAKGGYKQILRAVPAWVPADRNGYDPNYKEKVEEIEGVLWHSFQTWTDVPAFEYHRWFDWNFHVIPAPQYDWLRGLGNDIPITPALKVPPFKPAGSERAMELEWDTGAFGHRPGPMFDINPAGNFDPARDWAWPQTGQYVWAVGRHIYDCGHANCRQTSPGKACDPDDKSIGRMRSELHPCLAVASARWEAVKFDDNTKQVPAIQFMFFTSRKGGYWEYEVVKPGGYNARRSENPSATQDYEFIVDLPKYEGALPLAFDIGHTPDFPLNTLVLRPQLLVKFDDAPFLAAANGNVSPVTQAVPQITVVPPPDPAGPPEQVKIKLPLSSLPDTIDAYGVIVSMGWSDPDGTEAAKVRKVTVTLEKIQKGASVGNEVSGDEWDLKIGINGHWHFAATPDDFFSKFLFGSIPEFSMNNKRLELFLALDDYLYLTSHGVERDLEYDFMERAPNNRRVRANSGDHTMQTAWKPRIDQADIGIAQRTADDALRLLAPTFNDLNDPIGIIDNAVEVTGQFTQNPIKVRDFIKQHGEGQEVSLKLKAAFFQDDEHSAELFYDPGQVDYTLFYKVKVEPLP